MVLEVLLGLLAHGADPRPITWDEASANLVKFFVTILLVFVMGYPIIAPLFPGKTTAEPEAETAHQSSETNSGLVGWVGVALLLVFSMGWWLTRTSIVELNATATPMPDHRHAQENGGQIAMWGDFHAEVSRVESGEVRVYLTDSYNRAIAAQFFQAEVLPAPKDVVSSGKAATKGKGRSASPMASATPTGASPTSATLTGADSTKSSVKPTTTLASLDDTYRFARIDRAVDSYRVKVLTPGWSVTLKFDFDGKNGKRSLPIWCGTPGGAD